MESGRINIHIPRCKKITAWLLDCLIHPHSVSSVLRCVPKPKYDTRDENAGWSPAGEKREREATERPGSVAERKISDSSQEEQERSLKSIYENDTGAGRSDCWLIALVTRPRLSHSADHQCSTSQQHCAREETTLQRPQGKTSHRLTPRGIWRLSPVWEALAESRLPHVVDGGALGRHVPSVSISDIGRTKGGRTCQAECSKKLRRARWEITSLQAPPMTGVPCPLYILHAPQKHVR